MHILSDMMRFGIAPSPRREAGVGLVAVTLAVLLPVVLGAPQVVRVALPVAAALVYGTRYAIALGRRRGRGPGR